MTSSVSSAGGTPVAIVGIGCRFPGGVDGPASFWRLLENKVDAITEIPRDRFDLARYFDPTPATPGRVMTRWGGFLSDIDRFDAEFFGISPREAETLDPQQRLLLEVAWEALEDAGQPPRQLQRSRTGVFVGQWLGDFESRLCADPDRVDFPMTTGSGRYASSGRISYALGLDGPSMTVDTACSSSLVAVHLAVQSLRSGESDTAIAGGVNVILQPHISIAYSQSRMMAPDGRCKFGDASGDGYVRSEGAALVVLKPLARAQADGDRIYALIRGSAVNNDGGRSGSLGTPSRAGQEALLRSAYRDAGCSPGQVGYAEAHGTGTRAGDPVELGALGAVLAEGREPRLRARVGSVKTNIGHTEGAAGVAGLIKVALALHHERIPASLHCRTPNPAVDWDAMPFELAAGGADWPPNVVPRLAGVSAFGIAGTNAHVVLQDAALTEVPAASCPPDVPVLLPLSARSAQALRVLAGRFADRLAELPEAALHDACWTAATRRAPLEQRAAFVARDRASLIDALRRHGGGEAASTSGTAFTEAPARIVFVCPGQGGQWPGMARELMRHEPAFRAALERCDAAARPFLGLSLVELLAGTPDRQLERIDIVQPVLVALSIAHAEALRAAGIEADAVVGHSMGEVAAAYLASAIDLEQAMRIVCRRSALMRSTSGRGAMALVDLPAAEMVRRLRGIEQRVGIAVVNSPRSCVVSGDTAAVDELLASLEREQVFCRPIRVDVASHSPQMDAPAAQLREELAGLRPKATAIPWYSTVRAALIEGKQADAAYWAENLRQPVRFGDTVARLASDGMTLFVELGPHPVLRPSIEQSAEALGRAVVVVGCSHRDESDAMAWRTSLAALWAAGARVDWRRVLPRGRHVALPSYPWQRERHWGEGAQHQPGSTVTSGGRHPLLHQRFDAASSASARSVHWETTLSAQRHRIYFDHRVRGVPVLPAAATCEAVLAAARESRADGRWALVAVEFVAAVPLAEDEPTRMQLRIDWSDRGGRFEVQALPPETTEWIRHASGSLVAASQASSPDRSTTESQRRHDRDTFYRVMSSIGLDYGDAFRCVASATLDAGTAEATLEAVAPSEARAGDYMGYPPLLDAALQVLLSTVVDGADTEQATRVPVSIGHFALMDGVSPTRTLQVRAVRSGEDGGSVWLYDEDGLVALARDVRFSAPVQQQPALDALLHGIEWRVIEARAAPTAIGPVLVIAQDEQAARPLADALRSRGASCRVSLVPACAELREALCEMQRHASGQRVNLVHLLAFEVTDGDAATELAWTCAVERIAPLVRALVDSDPPAALWLVTRHATSADAAGMALGQAALWGVGRVLANEHPQLDTRLVDLDDSTADLLAALLAAPPAERQLARRRGRWLAPNLTTLPPAAPIAMAADAVPNWRAAVVQPGEPRTLQWRAAANVVPAHDEVEIEVEATGLNFINVMSALGVCPGYGVGPLGIECAGRVVRVGSDVATAAVGDDVIAVGTDCLARRAVVHRDLVWPRPRGMSAVEGAGVAIAFATAWHALRDLARLEGGESVLIHSAAGGVGLAALQVAGVLGARVIATAGTPEKREWLRTLGVPHVFDSRSTAFADDVIGATSGRGVDVVLNSLAGDAIGAGMRSLARYGRFIELGKRDIYGDTTLALQPFRKSLAFFAVDLDAMMRECPERLGRVLREVTSRFESGEFEALPVKRYAADALGDAFVDLMPGTHVGKHVLDLSAPPSSIAPAAGMRSTIRADGTYLVTGGLGALGLRFADWLAERGAGCIVLAGRSAPDAAVQGRLRSIEAHGARVVVERCDVSRVDELAALLERVRRNGPPLRGVIHAAGVLDDALITDIEPARARAVRDPKVLGALNIDRLTAGDSLEFVVLLSSVASLFGTPGQGAYAAANAVLDALAHQRRARGLPTLAVNLGPIRGEGLAAARRVRGDALARLGFDGLDATQAIEAIDLLLAGGVTQAACMRWRKEQWLAATHRDGVIGIVAEQPAVRVSNGTVPLADRLNGAPAGQPRRALLEAVLRDEVAQVLKLQPARVPADRPLKSLGLDSLMALELRSRLERCSGLTLSPTLAWNHPTLRALGEHLAERLGVSLDQASAATEATEPDAVDELLAELSQLDEDEAQRLLAGAAEAAQ